MKLEVIDNFREGRNVEAKIRKYEKVDLHSHEFIEFFYVTKGECKHQLNDAFDNITLGDAYLIGLNDAHSFISSTSNYLHRDIIIKTDFFTRCASLYGPIFHLMTKKYKLNASEMATLNSLCVDLENKKDSQKYIELALVNYLITILIERNLSESSPNESQKIPPWIILLRSILNSQDNFRNDLNEDILSKFNYTKEHIRRSFKKYIGVSIVDYWNKQKIDYAEYLLVNSDYQISEICEIIGIDNISYFYRLYKAQFGETPKNIRKRSKAK